MEDAHVRAFRTLRPPCVELSQITLKHKANNASSQAVIPRLDKLYSTLLQVSKQEYALNPKLSDYVFFPLSHIFRDFKTLSTRAVELGVLCLHVLIERGWRSQMPAEMAKQLVILFCFIVGGSSPVDSNVKSTQEDLGQAVFECLILLFHFSPGVGLTGEDDSIREENIPILGHTVVVILDGINEGPSSSVRLSALKALNGLIGTVSDAAALRNVFPGIVSALAKALTPKSSSKASAKFLVEGLKALRLMLLQVMKDSIYSSVIGNEEPSARAVTDVAQKDNAWLNATGAQVKMALANIVPLRYHENYEVRKALLQLCGSIVVECPKSLHQSTQIALETVVVVSSHASGDVPDLIEFSKDIFKHNGYFVDVLKNTLHDWLVSLPRILQSSDDSRKQNIIRQIATAFALLNSSGANIDLLRGTLMQNLKAAISVIAQTGNTQMIGPVSSTSLEVSHMLQPKYATREGLKFSPLLLDHKNDKATLEGLKELFSDISNWPSSKILSESVVNSLRLSSGKEKLATLWISLKLVETSTADSDLVDEYIDFSQMEDPSNLLLDDIYSFALEVLSRTTFEDEDRWELQALSLEAVALQSRQQGYEFRPELVDAIYPILERLGSDNPLLQKHAISCLSIVSSACKYSSPADLIVDNADYLINAVSLKLNTFSISPQAPQVLNMIIRLCGAPLIPYLDDVVESIFSILACYHGYPKLAESLFSILGAIVDETAKASSKTIEYTPSGISKPTHYHPIAVNELIDYLSTRNKSPSPIEPTPPSSPPLSPAATSEDENKTSDDNEHDDYYDASPPEETDTQSPAPKSKTLSLLTQIASSIPSHLTTPSTPLRLSLLHLLRTSLPSLAASDADTLLPLSATLFPILSTRLFAAKDEPATLLAALEAMTTLCACSGDFLSSRVGETGWWKDVMALWGTVEREVREEVRVRFGGRVETFIARASARSGPSTGGSGKGLWGRVFDAFIDLLITIAGDVGVEGVQEDEVFDLLGPLVVSSPSPDPTSHAYYVREDPTSRKSRGKGKGKGNEKGGGISLITTEKKEEIREVLQLVNPDALWLLEEKARVRMGGERTVKPMVPKASGEGVWEFRDVEF